MAGTVSKTILIGHLGKDPELKNNGGGKTFAVFSVATSESWKDDKGERKEVTDWHNITVFSEPLVRFAEHHLKKGMKVYIEGQNKTREWEKDGHKFRATDVVLRGFNSRLESLEKLESVGRGPSGEDDYGSAREPSQRPQANREQSGGFAGSGTDEDIPF